jgi:hypothetical protein
MVQGTGNLHYWQADKALSGVGALAILRPEFKQRSKETGE